MQRTLLYGGPPAAECFQVKFSLGKFERRKRLGFWRALPQLHLNEAAGNIWLEVGSGPHAAVYLCYASPYPNLEDNFLKLVRDAETVLRAQRCLSRTCCRGCDGFASCWAIPPGMRGSIFRPGKAELSDLSD